MEEILNKILDRFDSMENRLESLEKAQQFLLSEQAALKDGQHSLLSEQAALKDGQHSLLSEQAALKVGQQTILSEQAALKVGQQTILSEQSEMRREMGFYYGTLMKKLDDTKSELSSDIKHVSNVQKQHQDVLEILNEKQQ
ncbi:hypothetical protein [Mesobacillus subterraneus]|uniref:hypothetical protein n=1 Tax=Mesobacillus subterraneus TaxID=285983 RepID=UPI001CFC83AD|nr:hypothetical protein [Mesobacillus subterraneus]